MLAAAARLDNLVLVVDDNQACMLDFCRNVIPLDPLDAKFRAFGWDAETVDGHDVAALLAVLAGARERRGGRPKAVVARTVKGRGVPRLEADPLGHIRSLGPDEVDRLLGGAR
jgi:transketolase